MSTASHNAEQSSGDPAKTTVLRTMAQVQLRSALREVRRQLKKMEDRWKKETEPLHQARVSARRSLVCLELFQPLFTEPRDAAWIAARLQELLKASGKARDLDVLLTSALHQKSGSSEKHVREWQKKRRECQPVLEEVARKLLKKGRLKERSRALISQLDTPSENFAAQESPEAWANQQIHHQIDRLLTQVPNSVTARTLHKFRLGTKQTRYAADCIGEMVDSPSAEMLSELLADVQKKLGHIQDAVVAQKQKEKSANRDSKKDGKKTRDKSTTANSSGERESLSQLINEAARWIRDDIVPHLQKIAATHQSTFAAEQQPVQAVHMPAKQQPVKTVAARRKKRTKKQKATAQ